MARIAVDMDEVIADALGEHINRYNKSFNAQVQRHELTGLSLRQAVPANLASQVEQLVHTEDFFSDLEVFPHAYDVLLKLIQENEIFIATAAMEVPLSFDAKYKWLLKHFAFISPMNFVFCGDKSIINADYLIDDNARHFERFKGTGILFDAPHNQHVAGYRRVKNWLEVGEVFS